MYENSNTASLPEGHPVSVYYKEKEIIVGLLDEISKLDAS